MNTQNIPVFRLPTRLISQEPKSHPILQSFSLGVFSIKQSHKQPFDFVLIRHESPPCWSHWERDLSQDMISQKVYSDDSSSSQHIISSLLVYTTFSKVDSI